MKKKWLKVMVGTLVLASLLAGCNHAAGTEKGNDDRKEKDKAMVLSVADAVLTEGEKEGIKKTPKYDKKNDVVQDIISGAGVTYKVLEDVKEKCDIYLEIGKPQIMSGETLYRVIINGEPQYVLPVKAVRAKPDGKDIYDMGTFLMAENVALKAGDEITVAGVEGYTSTWEGKVYTSLPPIGDIRLYPAGDQVAVGYGDSEIPQEETTDSADAISGRTICWLGSSVTYGASAEGYSMADFIEENHPNTYCPKYAISGTTLANTDGSSYVARMKTDIDPEMEMDLMIVQLSTNDATKGLPLGVVAEGKEPGEFDDATIIGAMETIIAYTQETWKCPVVFYTGTKYDSPAYQQMVDTLYELQEKWGIGVIDLWGNEEMSAVVGTETYDTYMADPIHPNQTGYKEWWGPEFEKYLKQAFGK